MLTYILYVEKQRAQLQKFFRTISDGLNSSVSSFKRLCNILYKDQVFDLEHPNATWP